MSDIEIKTTCKDGAIHKVEINFYESTIAVNRKVLTPEYELAKYFKDHRKFGNKYFVKLAISITYREILVVMKWIILHPFRFRKFIKQRRKSHEK